MGGRGVALLLLLVLVSLSGVDRSCEAARVLGLFYFHGHSHWVMFRSLMVELARRGHDVTVVSHHPEKDPPPGYHDLSLQGAMPALINSFTIDFALTTNMLHFIWIYMASLCQPNLEHPAAKELMKSKEKFDVIITEVFGPDCFAGFHHHFEGVPVVGMTSSVMLPWGNHRAGNPDNPSFVPNYFMPFGPRMSFWERLLNTAVTVVTSYGFDFICTGPVDDVNRQYFGSDVPKTADLVRNTSLFLINSHYSFNFPRPLLPNVVEVGGIHVPSTVKPLPKDLQQFLDGAPDDVGAVLFTFGSLVRIDSLPTESLEAFAGAFGRLAPQRFVWKLDASATRAKGITLPDNVYTSTWLPQFDILSHPKTRAFISHGGLMGTLEAVHCGVPVLGIPLFADQKLNVPNMVRHGVAVQMDIDAVTEDGLVHSLRQLTSPGSSYGARAKQLSVLFRDRPRPPLEEAVYWVEYVIRHRGAGHLRPAVLDLAWYQYLLLDVAAAGTGVALTVTVVLLFICRRLLACLGPSKTKPLHDKTKGKVKRN